MPHVLVVDDDPSFTANCRSALQSDGYEVSEAESVSSAIGALAHRAPDAMLLDWRLPDGTGLNVLHWLISREVRVPTALVTGFWSHHDFHRAVSSAKNLGVSAILRRGIDLDDPVEVVRRILDPVNDLHSKVLLGNRAARELLTATLLSKLVPRLQARFPFVSQEFASDAITDAILRHLNQPTDFDPIRHRSIAGFIWMIARRNLSNTLRSAKRDAARDREYARCHTAMLTPHLAAAYTEYGRVIEEALRREPDLAVRTALREWLAGDQSVSPWIAVPSIAALSGADITRQIKRNKDRFIVRAKRVAARFGIAGSGKFSG